MTAKKIATGLEHFARPIQQPPPAATDAKPAAPTSAKTHASRTAPSNTVALTVRLAERDYKRLKRLAVDERISLQDLFVRGASLYLESKGLSPLA